MKALLDAGEDALHFVDQAVLRRRIEPLELGPRDARGVRELSCPSQYRLDRCVRAGPRADVADCVDELVDLDVGRPVGLVGFL